MNAPRLLPTSALQVQADGRLAAVGSGVLAVALAVKLPDVYDAAPYLALIQALLLVGAAGITFRLWCVDRSTCRLAAISICGFVAVGQGLNAVVGLPGAPSLGQGIGAWGLVAVGSEAFVTLVLVAARNHPKPGPALYAPNHGKFGARGRG